MDGYATLAVSCCDKGVELSLKPSQGSLPAPNKEGGSSALLSQTKSFVSKRISFEKKLV